MARRKQKPKFDKKLIIEAFAEMARERNIDRDLLQGILEETLSLMVKKKYGQDAEADIIVNMDKGDIEIYLTRTIVDEVENPALEISTKELYETTGDTYEVGDEFIEEITLDNIADSFGRRLVALAAQNLGQRARDIEKDNIFNEYASKVGEIIVGEVYQVRSSGLLIMHNKTEMRLPREEQIHNERYKKNTTIRCIVKEVRRLTGSGIPDIILSRAADEFMARLFEVEIPEVYDGIIELKAIAREPGERAKVAVISYDDRVDPVGACVGMKGIRIHSIVRELNNESIDIIEHHQDPRIFIARALSPARVREIIINQETRSATVVVPDDQVSLAIGKNGQNVRLASKLTGYSLSLIKEGSEDIELIEFKDEIGHDMYMRIIELEVDTAREFLMADIYDLLSLEGMTKELLLEIRAIILQEFDEKEDPSIREDIMRWGLEDDEENNNEGENEAVQE
ncbi:MAG: transcription termination factor NusA [Candidatus Kapaibacterium sp.]|jgi:N utilization substance protein A|nr:transcription termination factor NusA [Candidatus Kapabacteria bacterium]